MLAVHYLGGRLGHIMVPGHGSGGKMAQSKGKVIGSRNDVAVPKMKGTLLRKVGFYFITNAHARAGAVGVSRRGQQQDAMPIANANPQIRSTSIHHQQSNSYV